MVALDARISGQKVLWENFWDKAIVQPLRRTAHTPSIEAELWYSGIDVYKVSFLSPIHVAAKLPAPPALLHATTAGLGSPVVPEV